MLKIDELKVSYGGIEAVKGITFEVPDGKIVTLIGANGAGKSTTLRAIAGLVKPAHGRIHLQGRGAARVPRPDRAGEPEDRGLPAQGQPGGRPELGV